MADTIEITWFVGITVNADVQTTFNLFLTASPLSHGKWVIPPPAEIVAPGPGTSTVITFKAEGTSWAWYGVEGYVTYESTDNGPNSSVIELSFNIPVFQANQASIMLKSGAGNNTYNLSMIPIPTSGETVTARATITQIGPTI